MKKLVSLLIVAVLVLSLAACGAAEEATAETIKDRCFRPPLQELAPLDGERSLQGIKLAVKEINAAGGVLGNSWSS